MVPAFTRQAEERMASMATAKTLQVMGQSSRNSQEPFCVLTMLEADHPIVSVADHDSRWTHRRKLMGLKLRAVTTILFKIRGYSFSPVSFTFRSRNALSHLVHEERIASNAMSILQFL